MACSLTIKMLYAGAETSIKPPLHQPSAGTNNNVNKKMRHFGTV
jgi:hypothetical protein